MKKNKTKMLSILLIILSIISIGVCSNAHSGRTDSKGGHKDKQNKSGLGSYHYHCGGHPAHLHTNGICPYSSKGSSNKSITNNKKSTTNKSNTSSTINNTSSKENSENKGNTSVKTNTQSKIDVTEVKINEMVESMEIGESEILTATITPNNATDKKIIWKSSDEDIAIISATGKIVAIKAGSVNITATSSNKKTSTIKINVKEKVKEETHNTILLTTENTKSNGPISETKKDKNILGKVLPILMISLAGISACSIYRKRKAN